MDGMTPPSPPATVAHWDQSDFTTATDVIPLRVPLERVEIGRHRYVAPEVGDLELLYQLDSSVLHVKCGVNGLDEASLPGSFTITDISAADLSLTTVIPGSLESMVARLMLETEEPIQFSHVTSETPHSPSHTSVVSSASSTKTENESDGKENVRDARVGNRRVHSHMMVVTASVHEAGHMRDILLFLKGGYTGKVSPNPLFIHPSTQRAKGQTDETDTSMLGDGTSATTEATCGVTFLETMPVWTRYIPWWAYSRNVRISIQNILFLYSLFSVVWALWQLYRNVDIIHNVLEPIIAVVKEVYLASVIEVFDWCLASFTEFWMRYLSPLNVLQALLLAPFLQAALQLRNIFLPLGRLLYYLMLGLWQCLPNTHILESLKNLAITVYYITVVLGGIVWGLVCYLMRPVHLIWQGFLNSRVAVGSLDLNRVKLSWVVNLVVGSVRAIGHGVAKLCGYTSKRRKQRMAKNHQYIISPVRQTKSAVHPLTPVYYSSPLAKTSSI